MPADQDSVNREPLTGSDQLLEVIEVVKADLCVMVEPLQMKIEVDARLLKRKMTRGSAGQLNGLWPLPVL